MVILLVQMLLLIVNFFLVKYVQDSNYKLIQEKVLDITLPQMDLQTLNKINKIKIESDISNVQQ